MSIAIGGYFSSRYASDLIKKDLEDQLHKANRNISQLVKITATVSIRNYLRAIAEKNIELLHNININVDKNDKRFDAVNALMNQKIGQDGFIYCIDGKGRLVFIPNRYKDPDQFSSLPIKTTRFEGYYEYQEHDFHNFKYRPKADYSKKFSPWGWTLVVSAFRDEFSQLVQADDFKYVVLSNQFGQTGYSYILDTSGNLIIHPSRQGQNLIGKSDEYNQFYIKKICEKRIGELVYHSRDPETDQVKANLVVFYYLPEFDWIVASETYLEEFYAPLKAIRRLIFVTVLALIILLLPITYWLSTSITSPINKLMNYLEMGIKGDLTIRVTNDSADEIGLLVTYFNSFMDKLEDYNRNLQNEMMQRSNLEREIMDISDKERYRIGRDLHDDLCPHLIGVEALCKVLIQKLPPDATNEKIQLETIRRLIGESIIKTRHLSKGLCPVYLGEAALESALMELSQHTKQVWKVDCKFIKKGPSVRFDQAKATHLYYIARESVLNAVKHGHATQIQLELHTNTPQISLVIEDNGKGFSKIPHTHGVGLEIMKYRANVIGGVLDIVSKRNQGSKVICNIKAKPNKQDEQPEQCHEHG
jgi:signal transduction histidine kinase